MTGSATWFQATRPLIEALIHRAITLPATSQCAFPARCAASARADLNCDDHWPSAGRTDARCGRLECGPLRSILKFAVARETLHLLRPNRRMLRRALRVRHKRFCEPPMAWECSDSRI